MYHARAGVHIRILALAELPRPADLLDEDFWLIEDWGVLRMHYSDEGKYVGAEVAPNEVLPRYLAAKDAAWSGAVDFADYWKAHPGYWRDPSAARRACCLTRNHVDNPNPLSATLRQLRVDAGLSGAEAARRAGLTQSKVSRAETGTFLPTEDDIKALCRVYRASPGARRELLDLTRELREGTTSARVVLQRGGWWMQQRIGKLETAATRIRDFAPALVIGLLQTEDYVDALLGDWLSGEDRTRMISSRMERQRLLDTDREFILVMAEGSLRWNMGGATVMVEQLDRLVQESRRPNVRLGIIEWTTLARVPALHGFTIYDSRAVLLGTQTATAIITDRKDVHDYEERWAEFETVASYNDAARAAIERVAADYRRIQ